MRFLYLLFTMLVVSCVHPELALAQTTNNAGPIPAAPAANYRDYQPITGPERVSWFVTNTVGPHSLAAGIVSATFGTALNQPVEYGSHWSGFAKRYAMRLTGVADGNAIEVGLGRLWEEDPRYFHSEESRPLLRLRHAAAMVFLARRADGSHAPAFARYTGIVGDNFISNTWRVSSESSVNAALTRSALGFAGRFASNVFDEFWQDVQHRVFKRP